MNIDVNKIDYSFLENVDEINISEDALAEILGVGTPEKLRQILKTPEPNIDMSYYNAHDIVSEYASTSNTQSWKDEQVRKATRDPQVFLNLLSVVVNKERFSSSNQKAVKDCNEVIGMAIKRGANVYASLPKIIQGEREQKEVYESMPHTEELYYETQAYENAKKERFKIEAASPYKRVFDEITHVLDLHQKLREAKNSGDENRIVEISKELEVAQPKLAQTVYGFEPKILTHVAASYEKFVELIADPESADTVQERRELAVVCALYGKAKKLEREQANQGREHEQEDDYELDQLSLRNDDEN